LCEIQSGSVEIKGAAESSAALLRGKAKSLNIGVVSRKLPVSTANPQKVTGAKTKVTRVI
jgi:hypothetical protein